MSRHQYRTFVWAFLDDGHWRRMCVGVPRIVERVGGWPEVEALIA